MSIEELTHKPAAEVLRDSNRVSVGVVRILSADAGKPGSEREYRSGDEALVEAGKAEWVVAPVHSVAAGKRLDGDAERDVDPPPAESAPASPAAATEKPGDKK
jgi:hypothetical protein